MAAKLKDFATLAVAVVEPETTALVAAQLMRKHHLGALVVVDAKTKTHPIGILTDRDLVLELMAEGLDPAIFTAGDIMSVNLVLAADGQLVGIVTLEDVLELLSRELAELAAGLAAAKDREITEQS